MIHTLKTLKTYIPLKGLFLSFVFWMYLIILCTIIINITKNSQYKYLQLKKGKVMYKLMGENG